MVEQAGQLLGSLLTLVDPENHQGITVTNPNLIFVPLSTDTSISMSHDNRKVFYNSWLGKSFPSMFYIRSSDPSQSVPNFHKWMISLSNNCDWTIGLCDKNYVMGLTEGHVYGLCCKGNQLSSLTTECCEVSVGQSVFCERQMDFQFELEKRQNVICQVINPPGEKVARPQEVEIVWGSPDSISFYSVTGQHHKRKIITVTISSSRWPLCPFVSLEEERTQKSSYNSGAVGLRGSALVQQQSQNRWKCSCGRVYLETSNRYIIGSVCHPKSPQTTCKCGNVMGAVHITTVLCELL